MGLLSENNVRLVDRENETRLLWRFIVSSTPGIIGLSGPGGIGKTVLLWWAADECARQGVPCAYVDLAGFPLADSVDLMEAVASQLHFQPGLPNFRNLCAVYHARFHRRYQAIRERGMVPPNDIIHARAEVVAAFSQDFERLPSGQKVVVLLDNVEAIRKRSEREQIESEVLAALTKAVAARVIVASRAPLQWRGPRLSQIYRPLLLQPFDEHYARDLTRRVLPELLEREGFLRALKLSGGHPYSVVRLARIGAQSLHLNDADLYARLVNDLWANVIARFMMKGLAPDLQDILSRLSIVRSFDMSGLRYFAQASGRYTDAVPPLLYEMIENLSRDVSAIRFDEVRKGYRLQPPIRPICLELHRLQSDLAELNRLALEFYSTCLQQLPPGYDEWRRCIIELSYHHAVIASELEQAKTVLARALSQLGGGEKLEAAMKLRDELEGDWEVPTSVWQDVFSYFEDRAVRRVAA